MNLSRSKKGQESNYFAVIIFIFLFGLTSIITYLIWINFVTALTDGGFLSTNILVTTVDAWTNGFRYLDYVMILLVVFLILATGYSSYKIKTDSAYYLITLIAGAFWGFISYFFNYIFINIVSQPVFDTAIGYFPKTLIICTNLHWVMLVLIIVGSITLYGKKKKESPASFLT